MPGDPAGEPPDRVPLPGVDGDVLAPRLPLVIPGDAQKVVGEALVKSGGDLYYYRREDSTLEQDFFMRTKNSLVPVEVKAENGKAISLRTLITSDKYADMINRRKLKVHKVGISFSSKTRKIENWKSK